MNKKTLSIYLIFTSTKEVYAVKVLLVCCEFHLLMQTVKHLLFNQICYSAKAANVSRPICIFEIQYFAKSSLHDLWFQIFAISHTFLSKIVSQGILQAIH